MLKRLWPILLLQACGTTGGSSVPATTEDTLATTNEIKVYPRLSYFTKESGASIIVTGGVEPDIIKCKQYRCAGPLQKDSVSGCYIIGLGLWDMGLNFFEVVIGDTTYDIRLLRLPDNQNNDEPIDYLTLTEDQRDALYNKPVSNLLGGREIVLSVVDHYRSLFEQLVRLNGGICKDQISETTDFLLYDMRLPKSEQLETAKKFGVQVISEQEFRPLIHSQPAIGKEK